MRFATLSDGSRDGCLALVDPRLAKCVRVSAIARTLQAALDDWARVSPALQARYGELESSGWQGAEALDPTTCMAPLPRAFQWADASVYRHHAELLYSWRKVPIPSTYEHEPLVYQGGSDVMIGGTQPIEAADESHDIDLEAEIAVITDDVPMGTSAEAALDRIRLVVLMNDVSLRGLIPGELAKGFGFYQSKPASSFAPVAVTPDELGSAWRGAMLHLPVVVHVNGQWLGAPDAASETVFHFGHILAHLARTRSLVAGSIIGAGTISNRDPATGSACITEARVRQSMGGVPDSALMPYLRNGDTVRIEVLDANGRSVFGAIDQQVLVR